MTDSVNIPYEIARQRKKERNRTLDVRPGQEDPEEYRKDMQRQKRIYEVIRSRRRRRAQRRIQAHEEGQF